MTVPQRNEPAQVIDHAPWQSLCSPSSEEQITVLGKHLQTLFTTVAPRLGRETGFVQRISPITAAAFAQTCIFGWLARPEGSYSYFQQVLGFLGISVSEQAFEQRMKPPAATFLLRFLEAFVSLTIASEPVQVEVLRRFNGVYLQDGSIISLPSCLYTQWQGSSGKQETVQRSGLQMQVRLEMSTGAINGPFLQDERCSERSGALAMETTPIPVAGLWVVDMGWFAVATMQRMSDEGRFWLTHAKCDLIYRDEHHVRSSLAELLARNEHDGVVDIAVHVCKQQMPARLIAFRVSPEDAQRRRERMDGRAATRGKGSRRDVGVGNAHQRPSIDGRKRAHTGKARYALAEWTILLTNVPASMLSVSEARVLMRLRWQLELIWKLWKQQGQVDIWRSENPSRILCEVYAKLAGCVLQHWLTIVGCWSDPHRSMVKASHAVQALSLCFLFALQGWFETPQLIARLCGAMSKSRVNSRRKAPNTSQLVLDPLRHHHPQHVKRE